MNATAKTMRAEPRGRQKVDSPVTKKYVTLDDDTIKVLTKIGNGNLSKGIREAARRLGRAQPK